MAEGLCALCLAVLGLEATYCGPVLPVGVGSGEISRGGVEEDERTRYNRGLLLM